MEAAAPRTPSSGRDAGWLAGADLLAVAMAFFGQILLVQSLAAEDYGWMVLAVDLYASLFLIIDLGLPTLLPATVPTLQTWCGQRSNGPTVGNWWLPFRFC